MRCQPRGLVPPVVSTSLLAVLAAVPTVAVGAPPESATVLAQAEEFGLATRTAIRFLATLIVGGLLAVGVTAFAPRFAEDRVRAASDRPGGYLLWGLLGAVVVPVVLAILAATVVGLLIALPGLLAHAVAGLAGTGIAVLWVGSWLTDTAELGGRAVLAGTVVYAVANSVPLVGPLVVAVVNLIAFGTVIEAGYGALRDWWRNRGSSDASTPTRGRRNRRRR